MNRKWQLQLVFLTDDFQPEVNRQQLILMTDDFQPEVNRQQLILVDERLIFKYVGSNRKILKMLLSYARLIDRV